MTALAPPQQPVPPAPRVRGSLGNRRRLIVAIAILVGAFGFLVYRGLGNATLYFRTADEAVAQKATLGTRRFRIEGTVLPGTIRTVAQTVDFRIMGPGGAQVAIEHHGDQPQLFTDGTPVVLEGRWDGDHFASDRIMIKHSEDYKTQHPDRLSGTSQ